MGRAMISRMNLSDSQALAARLASLLRQEHHALADFLVALADFDQRRGWLELGYSGLFPFLNRELVTLSAQAQVSPRNLPAPRARARHRRRSLRCPHRPARWRSSRSLPPRSGCT